MAKKLDREAAFSQAVELLYDAVAEPNRWIEALDHVQGLFGASSSRIFLWDVRADRMPVFMNSSTYFGHSAKWDLQITDPRRRILERSSSGYILACHEHITESFVSKSAFFNDYSLPFGRRYLMASNMFSESSVISIFSLFRDRNQGCFDGEDRVLFERLNVHLQRVGRIHRQLVNLQTQNGLHEKVLDCLQAALFVTDARSRIVRLNAAAESLLASRDLLHIQTGHLHTRTQSETQKLHARIARSVAAKNGLGASPGGSIILEDLAGHRHAVTISPLSDRSIVLGKPEQPLVLVTVGSLQPSSVSAQQLVDLFGLTLAEARLANEILSGRRLEQVASEREVKMPTLRTQIAAIFTKTGTRRQAELVQMLTQLASLRGTVLRED